MVALLLLKYPCIVKTAESRIVRLLQVARGGRAPGTAPPQNPHPHLSREAMALSLLRLSELAVAVEGLAAKWGKVTLEDVWFR